MVNNYNQIKSSGLRPSEINDSPWVYAKRLINNYPQDTERAGKWITYISFRNIDPVWRKIKLATEAGLLGGYSKCATAIHNPQASTKIICSYTYDSQDFKDVMRIRNQLRKLGIVRPIPYKLESDTELGIYKENHIGRISLYFE